MVTIKDDCGCGCDPCSCDWKQKLKEAYARASISVNKVGDLDGRVYYPDGSGFVKLPLPNLSEIQQISDNAQNIADLKIADAQMQADIAAEETARKSKDDALDAVIARIDATDTAQSEQIGDNAERITSTYNDLVATEATVAAHDSKIITLEASNETLAKSLVSDVLMSDGTTAGSVQVSIEREDGTLITSANYRWGRDIGLRLEAGTQEGYVKAVIDLSDGTVLESNEYKIVEVLESDVYVTAITLVADQTAGTLGGNISYSNGTTQTINNVSVPTAPGVTSALEALQSRMTAVEQKNTAQDASISALDARVQAIEDTPGVGQFAAGKLGTIAGSAADGKVKAESDGTGSVNGWSALKQRVTTAERQIVAVQGDVSDLDGRVGNHDTEISDIMADISTIEAKNTQQDQSIAANTSALAGKVDVAQGAENAGKILAVDDNGNVMLSDNRSEIMVGNISKLGKLSIGSSNNQGAAVIIDGIVTKFITYTPSYDSTLIASSIKYQSVTFSETSQNKYIMRHKLPDEVFNKMIDDFNFRSLENGTYDITYIVTDSIKFVYYGQTNELKITVNNGNIDIIKNDAPSISSRFSTFSNVMYAICTSIQKYYS